MISKDPAKIGNSFRILGGAGFYVRSSMKLFVRFFLPTTVVMKPRGGEGVSICANGCNAVADTGTE